MTVKDLEDLFDYNYWANKKLFEVIFQLTPEQFIQTVDGSHGSIRNTMVHMLSAEWGWLGRCGGIESLQATWNKIEMLLRKFLSSLQDSGLTRPVEFAIAGTEKQSRPIGELMHHAANHGVHHRGQVSLLLRLLGYNPDNFDLFLYHAEKHRLRAS
jgi:uncharacterized damage-inducible protein DinB